MTTTEERTAAATTSDGRPAAALVARELYRFFRAGEEETLALRGVSLSVAPGEQVAVVGPSGSGKSTLLACLAGLDEPDGGDVRIAGQRLSHRAETERAALRNRYIGVLYQSGNLLEHLTVVQNVRFVQRLHGHSTGRRPHELRDAVELLDAVALGGRAGAYPAALSGGETARAGLAVALANDPVVLIADEPTGELDAASEQRILGLLRARADQGTAVVVASHSTAVRESSDRAVQLRDGRVAGP
jgi:putative ABC transport system ATP-binding protein